MTQKFLIGLACSAMIFLSLACMLSPTTQPATSQTSTVIEASQETATPIPTKTVDVQATIRAENESATATAEAEKKAALQAATQTSVAKATQQETARIARTATVEAAATMQAKGMSDIVNGLKSQGVLKNTQGGYHVIEDFKENWAQIGWYQWWTTGYQPKDFVIRAHTAWESASKTADWYSAGCGFVFRAKDEKNHYMIFLALDSNVYLKGYIDSKYRELGREYAGQIDHLKGEADVMLVVEGDKIVYFVNDKKVFERQNSELTAGDLGLTLVSGTNLDYGTRCEMTNIELWDLSQ